MKTIGLAGGTGWISTVEYYRIINEEMNRRRGGLNFARCILFSVDYGDINECNRRNDREGVFRLMLDASEKLVACGAECLVICANTLHQFADEFERRLDIPLIHIATETAREIKKQGLEKIGLLGTRQTMEMDFYSKKLEENGIEVIVPEEDDRVFIQYVIDNEIMKGLFLKESKDRFIRIMKSLADKGARGIVLGCTEIPLLIKQADIELPVFNTLEIHARAAVEFALQD